MSLGKRLRGINLETDNKESQAKTGEATAVIAAALISLLVSFMIRTVLLRVVFASSFFLLILMLFLLCDDKEGKGVFLNLRLKVDVRWLIYCIAAVASVVMLILPATKYNLNESWAFFTSLNSSEISRMILGYFMLTVFPGYAAYSAFAKNKLDKSFEKIAVILALSYVVSAVIALLVSQTVGLTLFNYLFALWAFALTCEGLKFAFKRKLDVDVPASVPTSFTKISLIVLVCSLLIFSAYLVTLSAGPTDLALGGDIAKYVSTSNAFLRSHSFGASYVWFQIFMGVASVLTGLHPIHAFVGFQFLIVLFPLAFFTLLMRIFKNDKLATIGAVLTGVTGGLSSVGILGFFAAYNEGNVTSALWNLRTTTQNWPWLSNHFFIVSTMDWSLLILGFGFLYSFVEGKQTNRLSSLIIGSVFIAATVFTHNFLGIMIFSIAILVFSLLDYRYLKRILITLFCVILIVFAFDALSYGFFVDTLFNYYLHYQVFFASSSLFPYQGGIIALLALIGLAFTIPQLAKIIRKRIMPRFSSKMHYTKLVSFACVISALTLFVVSLSLIAINFSELRISGETVFPWYIYAVRYSPLLQLAILSVPVMLKLKNGARLGFWLMLCWVTSAILIIGLNIFFPLFITPIVVNRALMSVYLPLGALSALTLVSLDQIDPPRFILRLRTKHSKILFTKIFLFISSILVGISFLSYAYSIEFFYQSNVTGSMSIDEKGLYEYLEALPPEKTFLTYSYNSYMRLSSLTTHKVYAYYQYGSFATWSSEILFGTSSPEVAYYFLHKLAITHIVLTKQDSVALESSNGTLGSMLSFFPKTFNNSFATVFTVSDYQPYESSNYMLVNPEAKPNLGIVSESLIYGPISQDSLRIVGGPRNFTIENGIITQKVPAANPPSTQYLQLYQGLTIPTALSPTASFKIRGNGSALFNIGFYDAEKGWFWLSHGQGSAMSYLNASNEWTDMSIDLSGILGKSAIVQYVDFVAASADGSPATVEWANFDIFRQINTDKIVSNAHNLAYNALAISEVPFTSVEDYEVLNLAPNDVYFFSSSWVSDIPSNGLIEDVADGAYAVFLFSPAAFREDKEALFNSLGMELKGVTSAKNACIAEKTINFQSFLYISNLTAQDSPYLHKINGFYTTPENTSVPLIITFKVGKGAVLFINLPNVLNIDRALANLVTKTIKNAVGILPNSIQSNMLKALPYPEDLFNLENPNLINIYNLKGLANYLYIYSDIRLGGNISMSSDYITFNEENSTIKRLVLRDSNQNELFENVTVENLQIIGFYNVTLTTQDASIYRSAGELSIIRTSSMNRLRVYADGNAVKLKINQTGEEKDLTVSQGYVEFEFADNITSDMVLHKPLVTLSAGSLNASWEGVFWHNGKMFTTVSRVENWAIDGGFSMEITHSGNVILSKLLSIDNVSVTTH